METETVVLSAKYPCYSIPVNIKPGKYAGFFSFVAGHFTFEQFGFLERCGEFRLTNGPGDVWLKAKLSCIPVSTTAQGITNAFRFKHFNALILDNDWRIELDFHDQPDIKWSDFPGEIEIGFSFVEE